MSLWEYTRVALPALAGAFVATFVLVEVLNGVWYVVKRLRPRGRDEG